MAYRTKTYIAGDWTGDSNLIEALQFWNKSSWWGLSYIDAHEFTQARDKCPEVLRYRGIHLPAIRYTAELKPEWDIHAIAKAICG